VSDRWEESMTWYGSTGLGMATSKEEYYQYILKPWRTAFTDRHVDIEVLTCEGAYCGVSGWLSGTHSGEWLGEAASGKEIRVRFGFHYRIDVAGGRVPEGYAMFDLPGAFIQFGVDLYSRMSPQYAIN